LYFVSKAFLGNDKFSVLRVPKPEFGNEKQSLNMYYYIQKSQINIYCLISTLNF